MTTLSKIWKESQVLTATCGLMLVAFVFSVAGLYLDARIITGVPAWLKPAKFAISSAIFAGTMAWFFQYLTTFPRVKRRLAWILSIVLVLEVGIIDVQAARGTSSHFNVSTPLDGILFSMMGISIGVLWVAMVWAAVLLFRQRFSDATWGWALRLGMLITVIGSAEGGMMVTPTPQQAAQLHRHEKPAAIGAHTVGAPDGSKGLPGVGWSEQHGDLRIPHFFGLHAIQVIPFLAWLLKGRRAVVFSIAASYLGWILILTWQALRGQSMVEPDAAALSAFALWLGATLLAVFWSKRGAVSIVRAERMAG
jgi:hypothetical protein